MNAGHLMQIGLVITGVVLLLFTTVSLAKRVLTDSLSLFWGALSVLFILAGILLTPSGLEQYISKEGLILVALGVFCTLAGLYYLSVQLSYLVRKNQELAIQVSLLNQEHEKITRHLVQLTGKASRQLWRTELPVDYTGHKTEEEGSVKKEETAVCH